MIPIRIYIATFLVVLTQIQNFLMSIINTKREKTELYQ